MANNKENINKKINMALKVASQLGYDRECKQRLLRCTSDAQIEAVMNGARKRMKDR